jgi:formamidopyrimidine-DNA glycosylase
VPELPEAETIARDLRGAVRGATVVAVLVHRADVLRECDATNFVARVTGTRLEEFGRRAKCIVATLSSGDRLVVTPRFTGALLVEGGSMRVDDADYTAIQLRLGDGRTVRYRDVRRLGTVALMSGPRFLEWSAAIGPEPLDRGLTAGRFSALVRASKRAIKTILMDQRRLAGIGNIYANEALWRAGIRPTRPGSRVKPTEAAQLLDSLRAVLRESIELRGTSFRDYRDAFGGRGGFVERLEVYGRGGEPCSRCGTMLKAHHKLDGRATVYCPRCQP